MTMDLEGPLALQLEMDGRRICAAVDGWVLLVSSSRCRTPMFEAGFEHCPGRVKVVMVVHLPGFLLPERSSPGEGSALLRRCWALLERCCDLCERECRISEPFEEASGAVNGKQ